jgi:hypothetical protein
MGIIHLRVRKKNLDQVARKLLQVLRGQELSFEGRITVIGDKKVRQKRY